MKNNDFDNFLDSLIAQEKQRDTNPFAGTRILQKIESEFSGQRMTTSSFLIRSLQPVAIAVALVIGIFIGAHTARINQAKSEAVATRSENLENLKADLFIPEHTNDDNVLNLTH